MSGIQPPINHKYSVWKWGGKRKEQKHLGFAKINSFLDKLNFLPLFGVGTRGKRNSFLRHFPKEDAPNVFGFRDASARARRHPQRYQNGNREGWWDWRILVPNSFFLRLRKLANSALPRKFTQEYSRKERRGRAALITSFPVSTSASTRRREKQIAPSSSFFCPFPSSD